MSLSVVSSIEALLVNDTRSFETSENTQRRSVARCSCALETLLMKATGCFKTLGTTFPAMHCHIPEDGEPLIFLILFFYLQFNVFTGVFSQLILYFNNILLIYKNFM